MPLPFSVSGERDRADDRHLEPVEDPDGAEPDDHQPVEARPRQPVEAARDVGLDPAGLALLVALALSCSGASPRRVVLVTTTSDVLALPGSRPSLPLPRRRRDDDVGVRALRRGRRLEDVRHRRGGRALRPRFDREDREDLGRRAPLIAGIGPRIVRIVRQRRARRRL